MCKGRAFIIKFFCLLDIENQKGVTLYKFIDIKSVKGECF